MPPASKNHNMLSMNAMRCHMTDSILVSVYSDRINWAGVRLKQQIDHNTMVSTHPPPPPQQMGGGGERAQQSHDATPDMSSRCEHAGPYDMMTVQWE